jgi:hypothetical protein
LVSGDAHFDDTQATRFGNIPDFRVNASIFHCDGTWDIDKVLADAQCCGFSPEKIPERFYCKFWTQASEIRVFNVNDTLAH